MRDRFHIIRTVKTETAAGTVVIALAALAQGTRLAIFRLLVEASTAGIPAGGIAAKLGIAAPEVDSAETRIGL